MNSRFATLTSLYTQPEYTQYINHMRRCAKHAISLNFSTNMIQGCFLHNIGRLVESSDGQHALIGAKIVKHFKYSDEVVEIVREHTNVGRWLLSVEKMFPNPQHPSNASFLWNNKSIFKIPNIDRKYMMNNREVKKYDKKVLKKYPFLLDVRAVIDGSRYGEYPSEYLPTLEELKEYLIV